MEKKDVDCNAKIEQTLITAHDPIKQIFTLTHAACMLYSHKQFMEPTDADDANATAVRCITAVNRLLNSLEGE